MLTNLEIFCTEVMNRDVIMQSEHDDSEHQHINCMQII
jgi:hypothetical protein